MQHSFLAMPHLSHNTLESVLEPLDGNILGDLMALADLGLASSPLRNTGAWSGPRFLVSQHSELL